MSDDQLGRWMPLPLAELSRLLAPARFLWWVAGGHALDLFLGRSTRAHDDLDVEVLRRDQHAATADGVPYLAPVLQLLFKAKDPRAKDIADFNLVLPELRGADRAWLASALAATYPGHPWLARLRGESNL